MQEAVSDLALKRAEFKFNALKDRFFAGLEASYHEALALFKHDLEILHSLSSDDAARTRFYNSCMNLLVYLDVLRVVKGIKEDGHLSKVSVITESNLGTIRELEVSVPYFPLKPLIKPDDWKLDIMTLGRIARPEIVEKVQFTYGEYLKEFEILDVKCPFACTTVTT